MKAEFLLPPFLDNPYNGDKEIWSEAMTLILIAKAGGARPPPIPLPKDTKETNIRKMPRPTKSGK